MRVSSKSDAYANDMVGILFYGYESFIFPCMAYLPGELVLFKSSRFTIPPPGPTLHEQAARLLVKLSTAMMRYDNVIASGFAIQDGLLKFHSGTLNSSFKGGNSDRLMNPLEQTAIKAVVEKHFGRPFQLG